MKFNKIFIVGGIGAGKTTLAQNLSKITRIKHYELDNIVYRKRDIHKKNTAKVRNKKLNLILKKKVWIIEGFHDHPWTYKIYKKAQVIVILNTKTSISKLRVIKRYLKRKLHLENTKNVNQSLRIAIRLLKRLSETSKKNLREQKKIAKRFKKNVIILNNNKEVKHFLKSLK